MTSRVSAEHFADHSVYGQGMEFMAVFIVIGMLLLVLNVLLMLAGAMGALLLKREVVPVGAVAAIALVGSVVFTVGVVFYRAPTP